MAVKLNSFQITFFSPLVGENVIRVLEAEKDFPQCFSEAQGLLRIDSEEPTTLEAKRRYPAVTLVIADGVPVEKARSVAQRLQLRFDTCRY